VKTFTLEDFKKWGAQGSKNRHHRKLSKAQARRMVAAREKKRRP
jgi:hypothetical protein